MVAVFNLHTTNLKNGRETCKFLKSSYWFTFINLHKTDPDLEIVYMGRSFLQVPVIFVIPNTQILICCYCIFYGYLLCEKIQQLTAWSNLMVMFICRSFAGGGRRGGSGYIKTCLPNKMRGVFATPPPPILFMLT
jgi:hypothetical protein